jgi:hypothetical protein
VRGPCVAPGGAGSGPRNQLVGEQRACRVPCWVTRLPVWSQLEGGLKMARTTVLVSDLSGRPIPEGKAATITIAFTDARKGVYVLDLSEEEAEELGSKGRKQARRGRPRKSA